MEPRTLKGGEAVERGWWVGGWVGGRRWVGGWDVPASHNQGEDVDGDDVNDEDIPSPGGHHVEVGEGA